MSDVIATIRKLISAPFIGLGMCIVCVGIGVLFIGIVILDNDPTPRKKSS